MIDHLLRLKIKKSLIFLKKYIFDRHADERAFYLNDVLLTIETKLLNEDKVFGMMNKKTCQQLIIFC